MSVHIDIQVESDLWGSVERWEPLANHTVVAVCDRLGISRSDSELSILMTHDAVIQHLNEQWRDIDKPTNVLSFPAVPGGRKGVLPPLIGDIVLAFETVNREAQLEGKSLEHHVMHLIVHGFLHLLGYDHENDLEALDMETLEIKILADLNVDDPYR